MLITQISNQLLLWYFQRQFLLQTLNLLPFQKLWMYRRIKQNETPTQRKHWNRVIYRSSADRASYYYNIKVLVYNVYLVNNPYSYSELSIFVLFFHCERHMLRWYILIFVICHIEGSYINSSHNFWICAVFLISVATLWGSQRIPWSLYWDLEAKNHLSSAICCSVGKIQHMFMYINTLRLSTFIIYSSNFFKCNSTHHLCS